MKEFSINVFSERLKELREERGLSCRQLAKEILVQHITVSRWERGERLPNIEMIFKLAIFFGVPSDYLIGIED